METLRVYRPRIVVHGPVGMGQNYIGTAALHHLEGYNVQNLDLGTLLSDSTRVRLHVVIAKRTLTISLPPTSDERGRHCPTFCRGETKPAIYYLHSVTSGLVLRRIGDMP